ncbi:MAG: hypothetical protein ACFE89_09550 [Candidatus Hodarchaeota archaeon]
MSTTVDLSKKIKELSIAQVTGLVLVWYVIAVVVSRLVTEVLSPGISIETSIYHFHHILWGLILMSFGGFIAMYWESRRAKAFSALFFGLGLGLAIDEVGLILVTSDVGYFDPISYPIMIIVAQLLFIAWMAARQQKR